MDWMKIITAIALIGFIVYMFPRAKHMLENSPEGSTSDWMSALIPIALVGGFIAFLVAVV